MEKDIEKKYYSWTVKDIEEYKKTKRNKEIEEERVEEIWQRIKSVAKECMVKKKTKVRKYRLGHND